MAFAEKWNIKKIVFLDKVSYLCTVILNFSNYGTRQETFKQQAKGGLNCVFLSQNWKNDAAVHRYNIF